MSNNINFEQLKKNQGWHVQIVPQLALLDSYGRELQRVNDFWLVESVSSEGVRISRIGTGIFYLLGLDHIYRFTSNGPRSADDIQRGFLSLHVQLYLRGVNLSIQPTLRPGEAVLTHVEVVTKAVALNYPSESGLQPRLLSEGYRLYWSKESDLDQRLEEGWQLVEELDANKRITRFQVRKYGEVLCLIKKRVA